MKQSVDTKHQNFKNNLVYFTITFLLLVQIGQFLGVSLFMPSDYRESLKKVVLQDLENRLPDIVSEQISVQIQELVWDKIKLDDQLKIANQKVSEPVVLKVGESIITKSEFSRRFQEYQSRPKIAGLTRTEQKKSFLEQLHQHYAILEDSRNSDLVEKVGFIDRLEDFKFQVFLRELLNQQIKPIDLTDIQTYYEENKSLFELDEVHSFELISSDQASSLQEINTLDKFDNSSFDKQRYINRSESKVPVKFLKVLRSSSVGTLTAVQPFEGRYFLIKKVSDSVKTHSPLKNVAPVISSTISFQRIRGLLSKLSNPLKFEFDVELNSKGVYEIKNEIITQRYLKLARNVLPKDFFSRAEQSKSELRDLAMELNLLFRKYKQAPSQYSGNLHREVTYKSKAYREHLVVEFWKKELLSQAVVPDSDLAAYYEIHKERFVKSVGRWVSHIFLKNRSKALKVLNLALDDPKGFAQLAKEHSEHPDTKMHGGDMRHLKDSEISQQMHLAADTLKEGEVHPELISGVNENGYHILRYLKTGPGKVSSFDEVKDRLQQSLLNVQQNKLLQTFIRKVMSQYPAKVDNTLLAQL